MKIAMTGVSGNMGREALAQTLGLKDVEFVRVLLTDRKRNNKLARRYKKEYGARIEIVRGSLSDRAKCRELVAGTDYVIHMAAVIPPASDSSPERSRACNREGTVNLVDAVKSCKRQPKFVHVSTMALYGNRNMEHPWGRVGDPLTVSPFDFYAMDKLYAERYVLDAELDCFAVLRQTAMLHPNMLNDNVSDGLMFHTVLNAPLEWVSSRDSGYLIRRIIERDGKGEIPRFWKKIYNIGAGKKGMDTGYDTFKDGFSIIGISPEKVFRPSYFATRNFHGVWFADGGELEELFSYRRDGVTEYWREIGRKHKLFALAKLVPAKLIKIFLFDRLLKHPNSPRRWLSDGDAARVHAYFGENISLSERWEDCKLVSKGDFGDYDRLRDVGLAIKEGKLLSHGYDETKPMENWELADLRSAAQFRGGECLAAEYRGGDPYAKIEWRCHEGHTFGASPYTVLRGGHWCPVCGQPAPWDFGRLARNNPFWAQVWFDSHGKDERVTYDLEDGKPVMRRWDE